MSDPSGWKQAYDPGLRHLYTDSIKLAKACLYNRKCTGSVDSKTHCLYAHEHCKSFASIGTAMPPVTDLQCFSPHSCAWQENTSWLSSDKSSLAIYCCAYALTFAIAFLLQIHLRSIQSWISLYAIHVCMHKLCNNNVSAHA